MLSASDTVSVAVNPNASNRGIDFGGTNAYVTFGAAPGLGVSTLTIETWFRRDGAGVATNTGTGGVVAIPLVTKGMAETEGGDRGHELFPWHPRGATTSSSRTSRTRLPA